MIASYKTIVSRLYLQLQPFKNCSVCLDEKISDDGLESGNIPTLNEALSTGGY